MPEQKDSEFTWNDFRDRVNNELADILGNFVNRVFVLTHKFYNGIVPETGTVTETDTNVLNELNETFNTIGKKIEGYRFRDGLMEAMNIARLGNKYLTETEPWKLMKTDPSRTATIMNQCLNLVARLTIALDPFIPYTTEKIRTGLNFNDRNWTTGQQSIVLNPGHEIGQLPILFEKITDELVAAQVAKLEASKVSNAAIGVAALKENIDFESFQKMDIRVAKIIEAERIPKTKKLLKLKGDTGLDQRTVVSGIAEHYSPEEAIGKTVLLLANLAPRAIKGVESQGMILMAENAQGVLSIVAPEKEMEPGNEVK
jgi:methionyl-tRNA synthetase